MRAVIFDRALRDSPDTPAPVPAEGEALVRVLKAGICNTDVEILRGYHGFQGVIGHEFVGVVDENGAPVRVVGEISAVRPGSPSRTWFERSQDPERTTIGIRHRDGAFADYVVIPATNAWFNVSGSTTTNQVVIPVSPSEPTVFYRLKL